MVDFIAEWKDHLEFSAASLDQEWVTMAANAAIVALRKVKTDTGRTAEHVESDLQRSRTVFERAVIDCAPPLMMRWKGKPANELTERTITLRMIYLPQDPPQIRLRFIGHDQLMQAIGDEFKGLLMGAIPTGFPSFIGSFAK